jgi:glutamyl/glutaminyl-tRNA synthetase
VSWDLDRLERFDSASIEELFRQTAQRTDIRLRDLTGPFYLAVTGEKVSAPLFGSMEIIGRDVVRARIASAIELLGGISGKRLKKLQKDYESELASRE